jgi:serine/threonine protein kinase
VTACPPEDTLLAFLRGKLSHGELGTLDQHVDACRACRDLLTALVDVARLPESAPRPVTPSLPLGTVVGGRYRLERFIGRGGMGEVYQAQDGLLHEPVALKTVIASLAGDPIAVRRLKREVLLARRITHPNVCRIFDFGEQLERAGPGRRPLVFLTMELLDAETLRQRLLGRGRLCPAEAMPLVAQMAAGLDAAHRAGVIHRDFKSDNVLLARDRADPAGERVVVTDFGLARPSLAEPPGRLGVTTTATGTMIGTFTHAAPEQLRGLALTPAADVHALGVVLYEMVTGGLLPFSARSPMETAERRLREEAPSPRRLVPDLDPCWEAVILRCLARDPAARFPGAAAVAKALAGAAPPPPPARTTRPYPSVS